MKSVYKTLLFPYKQTTKKQSFFTYHALLPEKKNNKKIILDKIALFGEQTCNPVPVLNHITLSLTEKKQQQSSSQLMRLLPPSPNTHTHTHPYSCVYTYTCTQAHSLSRFCSLPQSGRAQLLVPEQEARHTGHAQTSLGSSACSAKLPPTLSGSKKRLWTLSIVHLVTSTLWTVSMVPLRVALQSKQ